MLQFVRFFVLTSVELSEKRTTNKQIFHERFMRTFEQTEIIYGSYISDIKLCKVTGIMIF